MDLVCLTFIQLVTMFITCTFKQKYLPYFPFTTHDKHRHTH